MSEPIHEYMAAAEWQASRGLTGAIGDPLPPLLSAAALSLINEDPEAFEREVENAKYAFAMNALNLPEDQD